jgi:hypothetical protein
MLKWLLGKFTRSNRDLSLPVERPDLSTVQWANMPELASIRDQLASRFAGLPPSDDPVEISGTSIFQLYAETALFVLGKSNEIISAGMVINDVAKWRLALQSVLVGLSYASLPHYAKEHAFKTVEHLSHLFDWEAEVWMLGLAVTLQGHLADGASISPQPESPAEEATTDRSYRNLVVDFMVNEVGKALPQFSDPGSGEVLKTFTWIWIPALGQAFFWMLEILNSQQRVPR